MAHMRRGNFAAAWRVSDRVLQRRLDLREDCSRWPRHLQYVWKGEPLENKRVHVRCYHGLGDTLQFVRLLAPLRRRVREITLWAQPGLLNLLHSVQGVDRLLPLHDGAPEVSYDVDIELMELPHALRLTVPEIPAHVPYIYVPGHAPASKRLPRPHGLRNVGIVWRSGDWVAQRSIPEPALARLALARGVRWYSMQYPAPRMPFQAVDLACEDIAGMAARMLELDLIVCVDTMAAHLAGALGLPVWTVLHHECDWRWLQKRSDSPWYPTMRLFRQRSPGDWHGVIDAVLDALNEATASEHARAGRRERHESRKSRK